MTATTTKQPGGDVLWYALSARDVTAQTGVDAEEGLPAAEAERRLAEYGPNELPTEPPPSVWAVARDQLANPMNIMLLIVCAASTTSLSGREWVVVLALSLLAPAVVAVDKAIQLRRESRVPARTSTELTVGPAAKVST